MHELLKFARSDGVAASRLGVMDGESEDFNAGGFEVGEDFRGVGVAMFGFFGKRAIEDRAERSWDKIERAGRLIEDGEGHGGGAGANERVIAGEHLDEHDGESPDVGALVDGLAKDLFRGHVRESAGGGDGLRSGGAGDDAREAEVDNFGGAGFGDDDVGRLNVAVDDVLRVGSAQTASNLNRQIESFAERQDAVRKLLRKRFALVILHDDEEVVVRGFFEAVNDADIGMIERRGGTGFAAEIVFIAGTDGDVVGEKFKGDGAIEFAVEGQVDDAHAASAKLFVNVIMADSLSE